MQRDSTSYKVVAVAPIDIQRKGVTMHKPPKPVVGETSPTHPPKPEMTPAEAMAIAAGYLAVKRARRLARLNGVNRIQAMEGDL